MGFLGKTVEGTMVLIVSMCYGVLFSLGVRCPTPQPSDRLTTGARTQQRPLLSGSQVSLPPVSQACVVPVRRRC